MAFVVEDGNGLSTATAYLAVADADAYHLDRGHASWAALSGTLKQTCLVRATDYVDKRFARRFRGRRMTKSQALEWPRADAKDNSGYLYSSEDAVPRKLRHAIAEYALRAALVGELAPDPIPFVGRQDLGVSDPDVPTEHTGGQISRVSEKVDIIEETKSYMTPATMVAASRNKVPLSTTVTDAMIPEYPAADMLLEELIKTGRRELRRG